MTIIADHSPAPWSYAYSPYKLQTDDAPDRELPAFEVFDADQNKIFDTDEDMPSEMQEANARLASAAPKLLEALRIAESLIAADIIRDDAGCLATIRGAIAEATAANKDGRRP